jgi:ABC-2 type transport system ATP-binding protein
VQSQALPPPPRTAARPASLAELRHLLDGMSSPTPPTRETAQPTPTVPPAPPPAARHAPAAIEVHGLTKKYGSFTAVNNLTFRVPRGGVTGFVGPNGAGKTTTIRMLLHLIRASGGTASVLGQSIAHPSRYLPRVGALIEAPAFYPFLTGPKNLRVFARYGGHDLRRIPALLEQVGLAGKAHVPYKDYSLGMKQRLGIAAALLPDPDLLVLDEPTNGLDPSGIREVRDLLRGIGDSGKTVFVSSHLLSEVQRLCDHLVIIRKGELLFEGTVDQLLASQVGIVAVARDRRQLAALAQLCQRAGRRAEDRGDSILVHAPAAWGADLNELAMRAGIVLGELRPQSGDLEETVLTMTGRDSL